MNPLNPGPSLEDVLGAYAVESDHSRETLERYIKEYPQYAEDLVDLSRELARPDDISTAPLDAGDEALIESAWQRHIAADKAKAGDVFDSLTVADLRLIAQQLDIPRQILAAFRERKVIVTTIPLRFLERLADRLGTQIDRITESLSLPSSPEFARSYKADEKPQAKSQVTFERLLDEAGVSSDKRSALLSE